MRDNDESAIKRSSGSELRAEELSFEEAYLLKRKSVDPLNASDQDNRIQGKYFQKRPFGNIAEGLFICSV